MLLPLPFSLLSAKANSDTTFVEKGQAIDTIICKKHPNFSYALYLPRDYNEDAKWPVICIFDPGARGKLGIQNFILAAEKYGYIVACSNNSRNGDWDKSIESANSMLEDLENRFSLDYQRIYTSGFSGGSRVAAYVALSSTKIAGVIGCGAGFPSMDESLLTNMHSFTYIGLVGTKDMNYFEMFALEEKLNRMGATVALLTFDSGHNWPAPDVLQDGIGWIQLQAMKKGTLRKNDTLIQILLKRWEEHLTEYKNQNDWFEATRYYKYIVTDFSALPDTRLYQKELDSLLKTKSYKRVNKEWDKTRQEELTTITLLLNAVSNILTNESLPDSIFGWWNSEIDKLKKLEANKDKNKQRMASRILNMIWMSCYENGMGHLKAKQYTKAILACRLNSVVQPTNMYIFYHLARAYALNNNLRKSLKALEKSVQLGLNNKSMIENEAAFYSLKDEKRYKSLLAKLQ